MNKCDQFQSTKALPTLEAESEALREKIASIAIVDEEVIAAYVSVEGQIAQLKEQMRAVVNDPKYALPFLQPGRVVHVRAASGVGWGAVLNFKKSSPDVRSAKGYCYFLRGLLVVSKALTSFQHALG